LACYGRGFDRSGATANSETAIGLIGMDKRASLVGGTLEIETEVGRGTTVFVRIPLAFGDGEPSAAGRTSTHWRAGATSRRATGKLQPRVTRSRSEP
jgi:hypothetical protein